MSKLSDPIKKKAIRSRLARVEGQLRGVQRLIDDEQDCEKIAQQLSAARLHDGAGQLATGSCRKNADEICLIFDRF
jgi:DNA-binding FrmR family transcriptional regulator